MINCFSPPKSARPKSDDRLFWDQNLHSVSDTSSARSSIGIDEIKHMSISIISHIIFRLFIHPPENTRFLQGEVTITTRHRSGHVVGLARQVRFVRQVPSVLQRRSKCSFLEISYNIMLSVLKNKYYIILSYPRTTYLCRHADGFFLIRLPEVHCQLIIPLAMIFMFISYV
jgi:hypothetical protein